MLEVIPTLSAAGWPAADVADETDRIMASESLEDCCMVDISTVDCCCMAAVSSKDMLE